MHQATNFNYTWRIVTIMSFIAKAWKRRLKRVFSTLMAEMAHNWHTLGETHVRVDATPEKLELPLNSRLWFQAATATSRDTSKTRFRSKLR